MTTTTDSRAAARTAPAPSSTYRLGFGRLLRSEALKLFTLRSTWWSLGITVLLAVGIALVVGLATQSLPDEFREQVPLNPVTAVVSPLQLTMLVAGIFGAMAITGEYSTGMIRSTFAAEPRRGAVLLAKTIVVAATLVATTVVTSLIAIVVLTPIYGSNGFVWDDAEVTWIPLAYSLLAIASVTLLGLGAGFIIRNGAGAIGATVGLLFVAPLILSIFAAFGESWRWIADLAQYLPYNAAGTLVNGAGDDALPALIALVAWPAAALLGGWALLRTRDA
ncbi:ABC-2 type transport system permease protein [Microbacterium sp. LKL04]|uniref:ABC transporter permease n=1 Tax=Microbacterium sp. LKL04 TaxID=912630 RepID=UPI000875C818|nr:ABC transporter permease [Microbacterium sp. LKL04]SCY21408.1 ABC-2 type transport system permease protein [Microbacterium sp. LKL04]